MFLLKTEKTSILENSQKIYFMILEKNFFLNTFSPHISITFKQHINNDITYVNLTQVSVSEMHKKYVYFQINIVTLK